jgi:serine/threonine protein kinase
MELLGKNVSNYKKTKENFSDRLAYEILLQMLNAIEGLHQKGFLHRDIKPTNFVIGHDENSPKIYMVDFGLSKLHLDRRGRALQPRKDTDFRGTLTYASLNAHYKKELSRRDDLYSFFFVILDLLNEIIPWRYLKDDREEILKKKEICLKDPKNNLFLTTLRNKPQVFDILEYLKTLNYEDKPNYRYIRNKIEEMYMEELEKENLNRSLGFLNSSKSLNTSFSSNYSNPHEGEIQSFFRNREHNGFLKNLKSPISDYLNYFYPRADKLNKSRNQSKSLEKDLNIIKEKETNLPLHLFKPLSSKEKNVKNVKDLLIPNFAVGNGYQPYNTIKMPIQESYQIINDEKNSNNLHQIPVQTNLENDLCQKKRKRDEAIVSDNSNNQNLIKTSPTSPVNDFNLFNFQQIQQHEQDDKNTIPYGKDYFNKNFLHNFCDQVNLLLHKKIPTSDNHLNISNDIILKNNENVSLPLITNQEKKIEKFLPTKTESSSLNADRDLLDYFKKNLETIPISNLNPMNNSKIRIPIFNLSENNLGKIDQEIYNHKEESSSNSHKMGTIKDKDSNSSKNNFYLNNLQSGKQIFKIKKCPSRKIRNKDSK